MSDKAAERSMVQVHFGLLIAPACELAEQAVPPSTDEYRKLTAQFEPDLSQWENEVSRYATVGGVRFSNEYDQIATTARTFYKFLRFLLRDGEPPEQRQVRLRDAIKKFEAEIISLLDQIPVKWEPQLVGARTPFTTCLMIGDAISGARRRLDYFDRYLDVDFFPLYLRKLDRAVAVRLISTEGKAQFGVLSVLALAKLASKEFASFQLIQCSPGDLHDRNLRVDDQVFHLGTSTNSAGKHATNFTPGDSTANGHRVLDDIIATGIVIT